MLHIDGEWISPDIPAPCWDAPTPPFRGSCKGGQHSRKTSRRNMFLTKLVVSDSKIVFMEILNSSDLWVDFTKLVFLQGCQQMPKPSVHSYLANFYSKCTIRNLRSPLARCSDPQSKQCYLLKRYQTTTYNQHLKIYPTATSQQPPSPLVVLLSWASVNVQCFLFSIALPHLVVLEIQRQECWSPEARLLFNWSPWGADYGNPWEWWEKHSLNKGGGVALGWGTLRFPW